MRPVFYLLFGVLIASFSGVLVKISTLSPQTIAFYRVFIASLLFLLIAKKPRFLPLRDEMLSILAGFFLAMHFRFWIAAFDHTTVAGAVIPLMLQPVVTSFLSYLLYRERPALQQLITGSIVVMGVMISALGNGKFSNATTGDWLAITGTLFLCGYLVLGRKLNRKMGSTAFSLRTHAVASIVLFAFSFPSFEIVPLREWFILIALGAGCSFLGYLFINISLKNFPSSVVSMALVGETSLSMLWAYLFLGEVLGIFQITGFLISTAGLILFLLNA
ncbi:DMT family transporter [Thermotoga sp. SG1]|uniref:DMT family transporter n=1 Tax=Thermotoga sp. SG1 TaxID=126739 RepID=UPI000C76C6B0|nr:DMT family transporter [Thermotoga sp. SG1]PLV55818.1 hypothetical protein AS006_09345 [Thermotoga sp. SG1]